MGPIHTPQSGWRIPLLKHDLDSLPTKEAKQNDKPPFVQEEQSRSAAKPTPATARRAATKTKAESFILDSCLCQSIRECGEDSNSCVGVSIYIPVVCRNGNKSGI